MTNPLAVGMNGAMRSVFSLCGVFAVFLPLCALPAGAAEAKVIDNFHDWTAFAEKEGGKKVCYMASAPEKAEGKYRKRDDPYVLVTHRPAEKSIGVVSVRAGYTYKKDSDVEVNIDGQRFTLFTDAGQAWARDTKTDRALVRAMKGGLAMIVAGISSRGTLTTDTYSLNGFTAAYDAITRACGIK